MPRIRSRVFVALTAAAVPFALSVQATLPIGFILAADERSIVAQDAWARASAGTSTTAAAYVTLMGGTQADRLVSVSTPVAATAEVHETIDDRGVTRMRPAGPIPVPAGQMVTFAPGGTHIMLTGLRQKLMAGESFPLTLTFTHAAPVTVEVEVRALGHGAPAGSDHHMQ